MNSVAEQVAAKANRVMVVQLVATTAAALVFGLLQGGGWAVLSVFCGGLISLCVLFMLKRGVRRASDVALIDQKRSMVILYVGAAQRFVAIIFLFAIGVKVLGLMPLALLVGFAVAQASNFFGIQK